MQPPTAPVHQEGISFPMASLHVRIQGYATQAPPVVSELEAVFAELPDDELLTKLKGPRRRGRPGYNPEILWRCYVAYYYLGLESVSALIRTLYDNPFIALACGIDSPDAIPSQPTFSRFGSKLAGRWIALAVKNVMRGLTRKLFRTYPDFGKSVAIDSTPVKAWANAQKKASGRNSDPDAGWTVKKGTNGKVKYVWGYKVHTLVDTQYEIPISTDTTAGNVHDINKATPLLQQARYTMRNTGIPFNPEYVIADPAYSSHRLHDVIRRQYTALPVILPNASHKRLVAKTDMTAEWKMIYNRRTSVERVLGRLQAHRKLDAIRVRGRFKVRIHAMMSTIVYQAQALATGSLVQVRKAA